MLEQVINLIFPSKNHKPLEILDLKVGYVLSYQKHKTLIKKSKDGVNLNWLEQITNSEQIKKFLQNNNVSTVTAVPHDPKRTRKRGFSLPEHWAKELAKTHNLEYKQLTIKTKSSQRQSIKSKKDRTASNNYFKPNPHLSTDLPTGSILLVDDIVTTGTTLSHNLEIIKTGYPHHRAPTLCISGENPSSSDFHTFQPQLMHTPKTDKKSTRATTKT